MKDEQKIRKMNKKYERSISTQRAESVKKRIPMIPSMVLDPFPIVPKVYSSPKRKHLISYHLITSYTTISYHIIPYHLISYHLISYYILSSYIISREHIFFYNTKTSSMTI